MAPGLVDERDGAGGEAAQPGALCRGQQQSTSPSLIRGERACPLEGVRGDVIGAAGLGADCRLFERRARRVVGSGDAESEMPGPLVELGIGEGSGQRPMHRSAAVGRRPCVHGGSDQGVAELDALAGQTDQSDRLGGTKFLHWEP